LLTGGTATAPDRSTLVISDSEFTAIYRLRQPQVYGYIARRLGPDLAEELTAQAFAEAWAGRHRIDPDRGSPTAWLFGIATNLIRRHHRSEARQLRAYASTGVDPVASFDEAAIVNRLTAAEDWPAVAGVLAAMSPDDRELLTLATWAGLSYQELSDTLGLPLGTVKSRLNRARERLGRRVAGRGGP
jgi:RNA polymerase sigma factor (sigma-70 family)